MAEPQQRLDVFHSLLNWPAFFIRPDDVRGGELRGVRDQP
jgi:hypothetical protein